MGVIKRHDLLLAGNMLKALLMVWDIEWKREAKISKREISCLATVVVIGFYGVLLGNNFP